MRPAKKAILTLLALFILLFPSFAQTLAHFDSGMEAFNKGNYSDAVKEFKASLDESPDSIESRFYYALALYYFDKLDDARNEFVKVAEKAKDSPWGNSALEYIVNIDLGIFAPAPEKDLSGYLNLSYSSDDNISYNPVLAAEGADIWSYGQLGFTYNPTIFSTKPFSLSCSTFGSIYNKNTNSNDRGESADATLYLPFFLGSMFTLSGGTMFDYLKYDPYYSSDYAEGRLTFNLFGESLAWTSIYGGVSNIMYQSSSYEAYDSYDSKIGFTQNLNALIYVDYVNKFSDTRSDDFAYRSDEYSIGATAPFPFYCKLSIIAKYMNKFFVNEDSIGGDHRHDTSYTFDTSITKAVLKYLTFVLRYTSTAYSSNLDKSQTALGYGSYFDHVISLSFLYNF